VRYRRLHDLLVLQGTTKPTRKKSQESSYLDFDFSQIYLYIIWIYHFNILHSVLGKYALFRGQGWSRRLVLGPGPKLKALIYFLNNMKISTKEYDIEVQIEP